jgi:hypothetical protein
VTHSVLRIKLDDGQVIEGRLNEMTQRQLISYANHLYRSKRREEGREIMRYQHERFMRPETRPPEAT